MVTSFELRMACQSLKYNDTLFTRNKLIELLHSLEVGKTIYVNYTSYGTQNQRCMPNTLSSGRFTLKKSGLNRWDVRDSKTLYGLPASVDDAGAVNLLRDYIKKANSYNLEIM